MSEKVSLFTKLKEKTIRTITLDIAKCNILAIGKVAFDSSNSIDDVLLVDGLKYILLSISQLCNKGNQVIFDKDKCDVKCIKSSKVIITDPRCDDI